MDNKCPECGSDRDPTRPQKMWLCGTWHNGVKLYQSHNCIRFAAQAREIERLKAGIEDTADDCRCRACNWNAEAGIELAAVARSLDALLARSDGEERSDV